MEILIFEKLLSNFNDFKFNFASMMMIVRVNFNNLLKITVHHK